MEHQIINLWTKRIKLNLLFKLSYLNRNFALTLGYNYLNPALNNPAQMVLLLMMIMTMIIVVVVVVVIMMMIRTIIMNRR